MRYITINLDPGRVSPEYGVVDTKENTLVCRTHWLGSANEITDSLNVQDKRQREKVNALLRKGLT